jgi:hypothetical protein
MEKEFIFPVEGWFAPAVSHVAFFDQIRDIAGGETHILGVTTRSSEGLHRLADILCPFRAVKFLVTVHRIICT